MSTLASQSWPSSGFTTLQRGVGRSRESTFRRSNTGLTPCLVPAACTEFERGRTAVLKRCVGDGLHALLQIHVRSMQARPAHPMDETNKPRLARKQLRLLTRGENNKPRLALWQLALLTHIYYR